MVSDWAKKGYLTPGVNGLSGDESSANFGKGQGVFRIDGTWRLAELEQAMGSERRLHEPAADEGRSAECHRGR